MPGLDLRPLVLGGRLSLNGSQSPRIPLDYVRISFHRSRRNALISLPLASTFLAVMEITGEMSIRLNHPDSPVILLNGPWQTVRSPFPIRRLYVTNERVPGGGAVLCVGLVELSPPVLPPQNPREIRSGRILVGTEPQSLPDVRVAPGCEVLIRSDEANRGNVWVGSFPLSPGETLGLRVQTLSSIVLRAEEENSIVYWITEVV